MGSGSARSPDPIEAAIQGAVAVGLTTAVTEAVDAFEHQIKTADECCGEKGVVIMIYGPTGAGKTSLLRTLPGSSTIVYDVDGGIDVLKGTKIRVLQAPKDLGNIRQFMTWITTAKHGCKTVVVDTFTYLERRMVFLFAESRPGRGEKELVDVRDYGDASVKMRKYMMELRDLAVLRGMNVIFIGHEKTDVKGEEGVRYPALSDKLARECIGLVDLCGYMGFEPNGSRYLQFGPLPQLRVKTRYPFIADREKLDLGDIIARIYEKQGRVKAAAPQPDAPSTGTKTGV